MILEKNKYQDCQLYFCVLLFLVILEGGFFTFYGISRHYNYMTSINDLGCFDQAIWGTLHGKPFLNTILYSEAVNWLGFHFHPVLALFVPLYILSPDVLWLIMAQAIALPSAAIPIYYLARQVFQSERTAFFWSLSYLLTPFMLSAASWDFHPVSLAVPFIAFACLAIVQGRFLLMLGACLFILLCKEHFGLMVFGFGLLWFIRWREVLKSMVLLFVGIGHLFLVFGLVVPAFSLSGGHAMLSEGMGQMSRYSWLGRSFHEIFIAVMSHPLETVYQSIFAMGGWEYLVILFLPLFCLPLIGFEFLLPAMGDLAANLLSANPMPKSALAYHSVSMIPILITAAIVGSARLKSIVRIATPERQSAMVLIVTFILGWLAFPFFSLPGSLHFWEPKRVLTYNDQNYALVQGLIDAGMSLSVQSNIGAHFTQRDKIYSYPNKIGEVDAVILHLDSPTALLRVKDTQYISSLGHHLQMDPMIYLESIREILIKGVYPRILWKDPWLILMKGEQTAFSVDDVLHKIDELESYWQSPEVSANE